LPSIPLISQEFETDQQSALSACGGRQLPAALDREAAGFEQWLQTVGLVALDFEGAGFDFAAAAEGFFQLVEQRLEFGRVPSGGKSVENEDGFAAAVRS
jgi:hypothetical protein